MCAMNAPDLFDLSDDDGRATAKTPDVPAGSEGEAHMAIDGCPENAIIIDEA